MSQNKNSSLLLWLALSIFGITLITGIVFWRCLSSMDKQVHTQREKNLVIEKKLMIIQNNLKTDNDRRILIKNPIDIYEHFVDRINYSGMLLKRYSLDMNLETSNLPLEIELMGDYPDLVKLFYSLKIKPFEYSIRKIALRHTDTPGHTLEAQIYLNVPRVKGGGQ